MACSLFLLILSPKRCEIGSGSGWVDFIFGLDVFPSP
jgi:hypothetical protein